MAVAVASALATAGPPAAVAQAEIQAVTIRPDPSYEQPEFEGWGTSLVWFANITGGYPDEIRDRLADLLFGDDGLRLNIARYNIGGGNAPDVRKDYMKVGATMPGFWRAPDGTTREDVDWWDPDDPEHWDWNADANQRWWIERIKDKVDHWEAFSNSPPWFQAAACSCPTPPTSGAKPPRRRRSATSGKARRRGSRSTCGGTGSTVATMHSCATAPIRGSATPLTSGWISSCPSSAPATRTPAGW
jgi:hypothetical protein